MQKKFIMIFFLAFFIVGCQAVETNKQQVDEKETSATETEEVLKKDAVDSEETNDANEEPKKDSSTKKKKSPQKNGELTVHYIDVGQGDATLFQYESDKENYTILYDTGDWLGDEVVPYLKDQYIDTIDLVIISHPHADHIGQLEKVMQLFEVGEVWMSGNTANSQVFEDALQAVLDSDADYDEPEAGNIFDIGPLTFTVLHPAKLTGKLNEDSLSIHVAFNDVTFLFTGDASKKEEQLIIDHYTQIEADYLQLGHHGSNTSSADNFIEAVQPSYAIYSAGKDNSYGHPHKEVVSLFKKKGIPLYGTDSLGTIIVTTDGKTSELTTEKNPSAQKQAKKKKSDSNPTKQTNCIDLNQASLEELMGIKHIGEARAKDIEQLRPFQSLDDLLEINGIGEAKLTDIKEENKACIGGNGS